MKKRWSIAVSLAVALMFSGTASHAGKSRVEDGHLIVPRVDIFGFGAL